MTQGRSSGISSASRRPTTQAPAGFWFGGQDSPPDRLLERLEDEEDRLTEVYALQDGRERGDMTVELSSFREKLGFIAQGPEWTERRSAGSALRRSLLNYPGDPGSCLDALDELGEVLVADEAVTDWLQTTGENGPDLSELWHPRKGSLLQRVLADPATAAAWMLQWLSPERGGPLRVFLHRLSGVSSTTRRILAESAIAAYFVDDEIHLFEDVTEHLATWEQSRSVDMDVSPLTLRDTLLLHELTEMAVARRERLGPVAAHVAATVVERMCGRAVELAEATNIYFADQRALAGLEPAATPRRRVTDAPDEKPVLVVDDSSISRHVVTMLLRRLGHGIIEAVDGSEAVRMAVELNPQLIVLDLGLPDMDGLEALRQIRAAPGHQETPTIILTADQQAESVLGARRLGVVDYLTKPVDTRDLSARVAKHIGTR